MTPEIQAALQELYAAFANYPLNPSMTGDKSCKPATLKIWNAVVSQKSLTELEDKHLSFFLYKVGEGWGTLADFKHFLPRIAELVVLYQDFTLEPRMLFLKLVHFQWQDWDKAEVQAVEHYLKVSWTQLIRNYSRYVLFEEQFTALYQAHPNRPEMLQEWLELDKSTTVLHFCNLIAENSRAIEDRGMLEFFEQDTPLDGIYSKEILDWSKGEMRDKMVRESRTSFDLRLGPVQELVRITYETLEDLD